MCRCFYVIIFLLSFLVLSRNMAYSRDYVRIVGSKTVFPIIARAAEEFARDTKTITPLVESNGTGNGLKLFCSGIGKQYPDVVVASRKIMEAEKFFCQANGIGELLEIKLGSDAIIFASLKNNELEAFGLSSYDLFLALSANVPDTNLNIKVNNFKNWNEINVMFPDKNISIYGPAKHTGTYDIITDLIVYNNCIFNRNFNVKFNSNDLEKVCKMIRDDGAFIEVANYDESIILQKMTQNKDIISILSYMFYYNNSDKLDAHTINGVVVNEKNIKSGLYPLSRPLYIYVKKEHFELISDLNPFIKSLFTKDAIGKRGYLVEAGLIPEKSFDN